MLKTARLGRKRVIIYPGSYSHHFHLPGKHKTCWTIKIINAETRACELEILAPTVSSPFHPRLSVPGSQNSRQQTSVFTDCLLITPQTYDKLTAGKTENIYHDMLVFYNQLHIMEITLMSELNTNLTNKSMKVYKSTSF